MSLAKQINTSINREAKCFHCGGILPAKPYSKDEHLFCCKGCVNVYSIIQSSGLDSIYVNNTFGNFSKPVDSSENEFDFLDNEVIQNKIISFQEGNIGKVLLFAPEIHCASCIWLLEHLPKLHNGILQSQVNFHSKKISIIFDKSKISLKELSVLLTQIGYKPHFNTNEQQQKDIEGKKILVRLGVAGFAFGNIMLLSFPDYLDTLNTLELQYKYLFHYVSLFLSIPVIFFSASPYFNSAKSAIKTRELNMDIPVAMGILTLFLRSIYDIVFLNESGYLDSLSGFIFFLLIGRWYQHKTYQFLDFDKTFHSFFPISVIKIENLNEVVTEVKNIQKDDIVKLRNGELIPFDVVLMSSDAEVDYSFVTGEADIFHKQKGDVLYAGGKLYGKKILARVLKPFEQKYFVQLWSENTARKNFEFKKISSFLGKLITMLVLSVAIIAAIYWKDAGVEVMIKNVTAVLIIGCSCAFALSAPFLFGNVSRWLSKIHFFLKNADSVSTLAKVNHIVLDKTGTLTEKGFKAQWTGDKELSQDEKNLLYSLFQNSFHPLSRKITEYLKDEVTEEYDCEYFKEYTGKGIEARIKHHYIRAGHLNWLNIHSQQNQNSTIVGVELDNQYKGYFLIQNEVREGLEELVKLIKNGYYVHILTGDTSERTEQIKNLFKDTNCIILTGQKPEDKKRYIEDLQKKGNIVMMVGDGLNDIPALKTADFGVCITDDSSYFAPSGDAIMSGDSLKYLPHILHFSKKSYQLLIISYIFSFMYNAIGLTLAFMGYLKPIVAAIFMPLSSISVVLFAIISTNKIYRKFLS
ncbi:MAG: heavy metal translocating P-type ATPase metal-binding domain-containing protein [Bacteroidota bacterium]